MTMDRRTIIAIALSLLVLIAYPFILRWLGLGGYLKPANRPQTAVVDTTHARAGSTPGLTGGHAANLPESAQGASPSRSAPPTLAAFKPREQSLARQISLETPLYHAVFSSRGARLVSIELKRFASAHGASQLNGRPPKHLDHEVPPGDRVVLAGGPSFAMDLGSGENLQSLSEAVYTVAESLDAAGETRTLTFTAHDSAGLSLRQTYRVRPGSYALDLEVEVSGVPLAWRLSDYSLTTRSWPLTAEENLTNDLRALRATSLVGTNIQRVPAHGLKAPRTFDGNAVWAAVQSHYFIGAVAIADGAARGVVSGGETRLLTPEELQALPAGTRPDQPVSVNSLVVSLPTPAHPVQRFLLYFGPVDYFELSRLHLELNRAVDLGWIWVQPFSRLLLRLLVGLFGVVRNYGVAIVVLATLVRVLLHPLNMASMKSMRAMQRLQPEMERLREKHKNDAQAQNAAIMALYKENKVNPAGGCLPMLIQMPLFVALYSVLFNAIELRQSPFVGWIHDLSAPDLLFQAGPVPVRLLPILMAASGLLSQKLTPTDPRQAPSMYMMNAFMLVIFYNLPSGLVLYWTVMNLLTALQQWLVLRSDDEAPVLAVAAPSTGKRR